MDNGWPIWKPVPVLSNSGWDDIDDRLKAVEAVL